MHAYKMTVAAVLCAGSAFADFVYQGTITPAAGESVTVEFPEGDYSHAEGLKIELPNTLKTSVRLYGPNTTWTMPDSDTAYPTYPFWITQNGSNALFLKPASTLLSPLKFENFDVTTSFDKSKETLSTVFKGGTYNFYDPSGTEPATMPEIYFDNKNGRDVQEVVFSGADTRLPKVLMTGTTAVTNRLVFSGGTHEVMSELQTGNSSARWYEVFVTNGANVNLNGEFRFNSSKASLLDVCDSTIVFGGTAQRYFGNTTTTPWTFRAVNSSVRFVPNWACMGFSSKDGNVGQVAMSNCVFVTDAVLQMNGDLSAEFVDCVVTNTHDYRVCNYDYTGETTRIRYAGDKARSRIGGETRFGTNAKMLCDFEIAGGYHTFVSTDANWRMAEKSDGYLKFTVSGGTVDRDGKAFDFGYAAGSAVDLYLTGGTVKASKIGKRTAGSTVNLVANDSVFQVAAAGTIVSGFDTAEIGEKGFTIDTNGKNVTIDQSFTGTGKLILTGGGSVTFAAGCTVAGGIEVRGGTKVVFNGEAVKGLTVGKDGTECVLSVAYGMPLVVDGDLDVNAFKVEITGGTYEKSTDFYEIIRVKGALVGDTAAKWEDAVFQSGVSSDGALDLSIGEDEGDSLLGFKVRDPITVTVAVQDGEDVVTNKAIKTCAGDTLVFDIGADGSFASDYPVKTGAILVKRGEGTLVLGNENNNFQSVTNEAGTIVLKHPNALGGMSVPVSGEGIVYDFAEPGETASTFTVAKQYSNEAIRVEIANADVAMPLYDILNGGIVKDGPGAAAFLMPDNNVRLSIANATPWKGNKNGDAGFVIRQGEVAFRGLTPTVRELTYSWANFKLGVDGPLTSERVSPSRLVFDHVKFSAAATGIGFGKFADGPSAGDASFFATNHADVSINGFSSGLNKTGVPSKESAYVKVDDHSSVSALYASYIYGDGCQSLVFDVDHESVMALNSLDTRGNFEMNFRNGSVLRLQPRSGGGLHALPITYGVATHLTKFRFESGSTCYVNKIGEQQADKTSLKSDCRMLFDDGEWNPLKDAFTFCFERITGELAVKGAGLVLAPTNTQVWTVGTPIVDSIEGAGGLVKRGEGTVVLNAANLKYTGVTRLEGGVLDLGGSAIEGLTVESVGGAFAHGTLVKPTYRVAVDDDWQAATPAVIDPSLVSGRVTIDLGRTEANPLPLPYRSLAVATYTGDVAPDVSKWKATGTGIPNTKVTLSVDPSTKTITATADQRDGFIIFLQ